ERAHFRTHLQMNPIAVDHRSEIQPDAEFLELDSHRRSAGARLGDRNGKLAAGEEAGFLAALGNQIRLGQALEQAFRLQRANRDAQIVFLVEQEEVQEIAERELARRAPVVVTKLGSCLRRVQFIESRRRELLCGYAADGVLDSSRA